MVKANNVVMLEGRITAQPEVKTSRSKNGEDFKSCKFTLAVRRDKDNTDFIECSSSGRNAEFIGRFFNKGDGMLITGSLQQYEYEKDGNKRKGYQVFVESATFPVSKKEAAPAEDTTQVAIDSEDDLPF